MDDGQLGSNRNRKVTECKPLLRISVPARMALPECGGSCRFEAPRALGGSKTHSGQETIRGEERLLKVEQVLGAVDRSAELEIIRYAA